MNTDIQTDADLHYAVRLLAEKPELADRLDRHFGGRIVTLSWLLSPGADKVQPLHDLAVGGEALERRLSQIAA